MTDQIYNATNDKRPFIDVLSMVKVGGYIASGSTIIKKTGWRSSRLIDFRHLDHEPLEVQEYALEMAKAEAMYTAAMVGLRPLADQATAQVVWAEEAAWGMAEAAYMHSHPANGWGL